MEIFNFKKKIEEFLQAFAVFHLFLMFFLGPFIASFVSIYVLFFTRYYPLIIMYLIWMYVDRKTPYRDGRRSKWVRNLTLWKYYVDYFPQRLVKTAELPPTSNYIFCISPHGVLCSGAFAQFAFDTSDFNKNFPGIMATGHTLNTNFLIPFSREYVLALGLYSVSKETLLYHLSNPCGHAVSLIMGGSAEALKSQPGTYRVVLKNRKGFVKLAYTTGTPLVPIYIFGEVELYDQILFPKDSLVYKVQSFVRKWTGVAPCVFRGAGPFGILPRRRPVTTVFGKPIPVEKVSNPSQEQIDQLHKKFIDALVELFEEHKHNYIENADKAFLSIEDA